MAFQKEGRKKMKVIYPYVCDVCENPVMNDKGVIIRVLEDGKSFITERFTEEGADAPNTFHLCGKMECVTKMFQRKLLGIFKPEELEGPELKKV
jgi:hypothetical protein